MAKGKSIEVNDTNFEVEVINSEIPVLVDFWAPWCGACRTAGPIIEKLAGEYDGKVKVCKLSVDDGGQTATKYSVMSIPTIILFENGKVVDQVVGVMPSFESDIKGKIDSIIK